MSHVTGLVCTRCGREYDPGAATDTCPAHDGVAVGILDVRYDYEAVAADLDLDPGGATGSLWRYRPLLPVDGDRPVDLGAGGTPLLEAPGLSAELGVETLIKDETGNPTGSNKDRGNSVVVTRAVERGHDVVTCASTGNAAASLAGYAARAGLDCPIFVPGDLPDAKAVQPTIYGATVFAVDGSYTGAYDLCATVAARRGWYNCSAAMNPYAAEGKRTLGFEIAEGTRDRPVNWVAMAMGNGCSLAGAWKGLWEFDRLGLADGTPRMLGVQAAGAPAIHDAFQNETEPDEERGEGADQADGDRASDGTTADSIDVRVPHNAGKACRALEESGGTAITVGDDAILAAQRLLGRTEGVFVEPASAAAVAGVEAARRRGVVAPGDRVVVVATGTGLKDPASAEQTADAPLTVAPDPGRVPPRSEW
jgi:threonine synthase